MQNLSQKVKSPQMLTVVQTHAAVQELYMKKNLQLAEFVFKSGSISLKNK